MTTSLAVNPRTNKEKAQDLRIKGGIPGIVYGPKQESLPISLDQKVFEKLFKEAGESTIITLEGLGQPVEVLIKEVEFHPVKLQISHVDLYAIERGKEITTDVPLHFEGEAPATKLGAVINKILHSVEVTCRPSKLPDSIKVDLSKLADVEDRIVVSDLVVGEGVTINDDADEVVAIADEVKEEESANEEVDMSSIEVEAKGKTEEVSDN